MLLRVAASTAAARKREKTSNVELLGQLGKWARVKKKLARARSTKRAPRSTSYLQVASVWARYKPESL
jgi:hypothetical protein